MAKQQSKKGWLKPTILIILIAVIAFKITPIGLGLDAMFANFIGITRYVIYVIFAALIILNYVKPKWITQLRVGAAASFYMSAFIFAGFIHLMRGGTHIQSITSIYRTYQKQHAMPKLYGGDLGLHFAQMIGPVMSVIASLGCVALGVGLIYLEYKKQQQDTSSKKSSQSKSQYTPYQYDKKPAADPWKIDTTSSFEQNDTSEDDAWDDGLDDIDEDFQSVGEPLHIEPDVPVSNHTDTVVQQDEVLYEEKMAMQRRLDAVFSNYDLPLTMLRMEETENAVAFVYEKMEGAPSVPISELREMKVDIELGLELPSMAQIEIQAPFKGEPAVGILIEKHVLHSTMDILKKA